MSDDGHKLTALMLAMGVLKRGKGELEVFDGLEYVDNRAEPLLGKALKHPDHYRAACLLASRLLFRGKELPLRLRSFAVIALGELGLTQPDRKPGRYDRYANVRDNLMIIGEVKAACREHNVRPTRNVATSKRKSGCSIVAKKRGMKESTVMATWAKRNRYDIS